MTNDIKLLRRFTQDGSQEAFTELVRLHIDFVYAWALHRVGGNVHSAEDVTQQVFAALARNAATLSRRPALAGWLYTSTRFTSAKLARTWRRQQLREQAPEIMNELHSQPSTAADSEGVHQALAGLIDKLGERDREAVLLRFFHGHSFAQIGEELAITEEGARSRVQRALDKMRRLLASRGITSTAAALELALGKQALVAAPSGFVQVVANTAVTNLGSGGAASGTVLNLLKIMTTTEKIAGFAGILAILSIGGVVYKAREADGAQAAIASIRVENDQLRALERSLQKSASSNAETDAQIRIQVNVKRDQPAVVKPAGDPLITLNGGGTTLRGNPGAMTPNMLSSTLRTKYGPIFDSLKLAPARIDAITDLMSKNWWDINAINAEGMSRGVPRDDPLLEAQRQQKKAELQSELQSELDPSSYQQFQEFSRTVYLRAEIAPWIARNVFDTANPLAADQAKQLTQIMANHSPSYQAGGDAGKDISWDAVIADARAILSPDQLNALQLRRAHLEAAWGQNALTQHPIK